MASVQELKATVRPKAGKGAARAARYAGRVPGVIYGDNKPPMLVTLDHDELRGRIYAGHFLTTLYNLDVDGTKHRVIPRDFQLDAIKDLPMHVDFLRVAEGAKIRVHIPVHVLNTDQSPGVKRGGSRGRCRRRSRGGWCRREEVRRRPKPAATANSAHFRASGNPGKSAQLKLCGPGSPLSRGRADGNIITLRPCGR